MKFPSFDNIAQAVKGSISRFPISILFALIICVLMIYLVDNQTDLDEPVYFRILVSLGIGFTLMTALQVVSEQFPEKPLYRWLLYLAGLVFVLIYFFFFSPDFDFQQIIKPVRFISFFVIVHLFVSLAPFIRGGKVNDFWEYNKTLFVLWFIGALYALIIYSGLSVAVLAVDQLFDVKVNYKIYGDLFIIISVIFHPLYYTANFPKAYHGVSLEADDAKAIKNLVLFVFIPLSMLYFLILYMYGLKILITWNLPKGWVSSLVVGFSVAGTLSYLLNYRLPDIVDNGIIRWFKKWFFYILAPLVILLHIAIIKRIHDYGFTPERYFVLLTGIWLTILSGYFIISGKDNIKWIPGSLIIFMLIGTWSPIDAFSISAKSQMNKMISFLEEKKAIQDNKISVNPKAFKYEDVYKLTSMIQALEEMQAIDRVNDKLKKPVVKEFGVELKTEKIIKAMGLDSISYSNDNKYLNYNSDANRKIDLQGFKELIPVNIYKGGIYENGVQLNETNDGVLFKDLGKVVDQVSLRSLIIDLNNKYGKQKENLSQEEASFLLESKTRSLKLIITQLTIDKSIDDYEISSLTGYLLITNK